MPSATEIFVEPAFSASIDGSPLVIKGKSKPFANSRESELAFDLRDVHLGKYLDYAPMRLPVEVISGALDTDLKLSFGRHENHESALSLSGRVTIRDLMVKDTSGAPLLSWKRLEVLVDTLDPLRQKAVSYTHLDVYKRQIWCGSAWNSSTCAMTTTSMLWAAKGI